MNTSMKPLVDELDAIITDVETALIPPKPSSNGADSPAASATLPSATTDSPAPNSQKQKKKKEKKPKSVPPPAVDPSVSQFLQCDLRVGLVTDVGHHPEADGLYVLQVSYGNEETSTVCAGLRKYVPEEEMRERLVVTICNLKPRKLRGVASEAMILAGSVVAGGEKEVVVPIRPPDGAEMGDIVRVKGMEGERSVVVGKAVSGKVWDKVVSRLSVTGGIACYDGAALEVHAGAVECDLADGAEIH